MVGVVEVDAGEPLSSPERADIRVRGESRFEASRLGVGGTGARRLLNHPT